MCAPLSRIQGSALVQNLSQDLPAGKYRPSGGSRLATRDTATGPLTRKICYRSWTLAPAAASKSSRPEQAERGKFASFGHRRSVVKVKRPVGLGACVALMEHDRLDVMGATTTEECSISIPTSPSSTLTSEVTSKFSRWRNWRPRGERWEKRNGAAGLAAVGKQAEPAARAVRINGDWFLILC